jgi:predicted membrane metal-binding protein
MPLLLASFVLVAAVIVTLALTVGLLVAAIVLAGWLAITVALALVVGRVLRAGDAPQPTGRARGVVGAARGRLRKGAPPARAGRSPG